jgi:hypothetical protein
MSSEQSNKQPQRRRTTPTLCTRSQAIRGCPRLLVTRLRWQRGKCRSSKRQAWRKPAPCPGQRGMLRLTALLARTAPAPSRSKPRRSQYLAPVHRWPGWGQSLPVGCCHREEGCRHEGHREAGPLVHAGAGFALTLPAWKGYRRPPPVKTGAVKHSQDCTKVASEPLNRRLRSQGVHDLNTVN